MRDDVSSGSVKAARIALAEIAEILETYPGAVVAGGFVPYLLIPQHVEPHEGTVDIDLVLAFDQPGGDDVFTLHEILERRLFQQDPGKPFRYTKGIDLDGEIYPVMVELLGGGNPPPGGLRRIGTEDVQLSIISGMEVALEGPLVVSIPDTPNRTISVASIPSFLSMKALPSSGARSARSRRTPTTSCTVFETTTEASGRSPRYSARNCLTRSSPLPSSRWVFRSVRRMPSAPSPTPARPMTTRMELS